MPPATIAVYSLLTYESFSIVWELSLIIQEPVFSQTVYSTSARTLAVGIGVTTLCLLLGYPIAYYLRFRTSESGDTLLLLLLVIPFWTSALIRTIGWDPILGQTDVINRPLPWAGVVEELLSWLPFLPFLQMAGYVAAYVVPMVAPIFVSLSQIDEDPLGAPETFRGGPVAAFRYITFPLSLPEAAIGAILVFILPIDDSMVPQFLSDGESTIITFICPAVNSGLNYLNAAALSIVLLLVTFIVVYTMTRIADISEIT